MTGMDELVTWLRAQLDARERQLDEDERVARKATKGEWRWVDPGGRFKQALIADWSPVIVRSADPDVYPSKFDAEHIARWDPKRVLDEIADERREINAKRRILDLHAPFADYPDRVRCEHCAELCHSTSGIGCDQPVDALYPCPTVRLLALPLAGRDGYQESWRP